MQPMTASEKEINMLRLVKMAEVIGSIIGDHAGYMCQGNRQLTSESLDEMFTTWCLEDADTILHEYQEITDLCIENAEAERLKPYVEQSLKTGFFRTVATYVLPASESVQSA